MVTTDTKMLDVVTADGKMAGEPGPESHVIVS
jgi:hypothetical protein